jgi:hypothetical protein
MKGNDHKWSAQCSKPKAQWIEVRLQMGFFKKISKLLIMSTNSVRWTESEPIVEILKTKSRCRMFPSGPNVKINFLYSRILIITVKMPQHGHFLPVLFHLPSLQSMHSPFLHSLERCL